MPTISIIIPNYNHAIYLKQRIDSVLNQTFQEFELIILDDCSTDTSKEVIELYRNHPKVSHIVYNEVNSGTTFKQWKKGIGYATGDYVWIAESDDWAELDFLEKTVTIIQQNIQIGLVYTNSKMYVNDIYETTLSDVKIKTLGNNKWNNNYENDGLVEVNDSLSLCCTINNASAVLFRRSKLENAINAMPEFRFFGDWFCYLNIALSSKIAYINECLNNYRDHELNVSKSANNNNKHIEEYFVIYSYILHTFKKINKRLVLSYFLLFVNHKLDIKFINTLYKKLMNIDARLFLYMICKLGKQTLKRSLKNKLKL